MPPGQAGTRNFVVTGFSLPVSHGFTLNHQLSLLRAPGIQTSKNLAQTYALRLVTQTIVDVLRQEGHNALLLDPVISLILDQLSVSITYEPLECKEVEKRSENGV
ncbi:hypothetical protein KIN20_023929, partial [Parelaphostrongylus tenuis]